jgi:uncharacterized membrane protein YhhN
VPLPHRIAPAAYTALAITDIALAASSSPTTRRFRVLTKPLLMPSLGTAFALSLGDRDINGGGLLRGGTVAAQALSGVGDVALLSKTEPAFLGGLGAFFGAHIAYTAAFTAAGRPLSDRSNRAGVNTAALVFTIAGPVIAGAAGRKSRRLRLPVLAYAGILSAMFAASTRLDPAIPESARRTVVAGTALFLASDSILGAREFLMTEKRPLTDAAVMATYTAGQGLIARGVSQAVRSRAGM